MMCSKKIFFIIKKRALKKRGYLKKSQKGYLTPVKVATSNILSISFLFHFLFIVNGSYRMDRTGSRLDGEIELLTPMTAGGNDMEYQFFIFDEFPVCVQCIMRPIEAKSLQAQIECSTKNQFLFS